MYILRPSDPVLARGASCLSGVHKGGFSSSSRSSNNDNNNHNNNYNNNDDNNNRRRGRNGVSTHNYLTILIGSSQREV